MRNENILIENHEEKCYLGKQRVGARIILK
jgi:hypothetical protein